MSFPHQPPRKVPGKRRQLTQAQQMALMGCRTDQEYQAMLKALFPERRELPDDHPLPEKFLLRLAHSFVEHADFWRPILKRVLQGGD